MKILCLCKRHPQGRDLLTRSYGRFYYLPYHLARKGHQVKLLLLNYGDDPPVQCMAHGLEWYTENLKPFSLTHGPRRYIALANKLAAEMHPDWIVGFSDTWFGILAQYLAEKIGSRSLIDAYDNYESYIPWAFPLHLAWRRALKRATSVSAAGPQLAELLQRSRPGQKVAILPMAADPEFVPLDQTICRQQLGLPLDKKLIGYCGAIHRSRAIEVLFHLARQISTRFPGAEIVISGRKEKGLVIPPNIRFLGYLPDQQMPAMLNSMDVLLVLNRDSSFGQYSYPVKLYEAIQCRVPVVASATAPANWILGGERRFLSDISDGDAFVSKVIAALDQEVPTYPSLAAWENVAGELEKILK